MIDTDTHAGTHPGTQPGTQPDTHLVTQPDSGLYPPSSPARVRRSPGAARRITEPVRASAPLALRLQAEWDSLSHRRSSTRRAQQWFDGWTVTTIGFDDLDQLLDLAGFRHLRRGVTAEQRTGPTAEASGHTAPRDDVASSDRTQRDEVANAVIGRLLEVASTDELAARIVLQRLLPGLVTLSRRWGRGSAALEELVSAAWGVIRGFNLARHPRFYAVALLSDCEYFAFRRARRQRRADGPLDPATFDERPGVDQEPEPCTVLIEAITAAHHAGALQPGDIECLVGLLSGRPAADLAAELRIGTRMLRYRRADAVTRLRRFVVASECDGESDGESHPGTGRRVEAA